MNSSTKLVVAVVSCWPAAAFAYIDPGTGSLLIQGLIAAIAAAGVTLRFYWHRFVGWFRRKPVRRAGPEQAPQGSSETRQEELRP